MKRVNIKDIELEDGDTAYASCLNIEDRMIMLEINDKEYLINKPKTHMKIWDNIEIGDSIEIKFMRYNGNGKNINIKYARLIPISEIIHYDEIDIEIDNLTSDDIKELNHRDAIILVLKYKLSTQQEQ